MNRICNDKLCIPRKLGNGHFDTTNYVFVHEQTYDANITGHNLA